MNPLNYIYAKAPIAIQNLMVTTYGKKLHKKRYSNPDKLFWEQLNSNLQADPEKLNVYQNTKFLEMLRYAVENVPFYTSYFNDHGININDFNSVDDIKKLPIITKELIRIDPIQFVSKNIPPKKLLSDMTSGTTGKPLRTYYNLDVLRKHLLFFNRFRNLIGTEIGVTRVTFNSRQVVPFKHDNPPFYRYDKNENNYLFSNYHISKKNLPLYYQAIKKIDPVEIDTFPSSLYLLARYMEENSLKGIYPKAIVTTGEILLDHERELIEHIFECKISDQYGCDEKIIFAHRCDKGNYHIHNDYSVVEVLDKDGKEITNGIGYVHASTLFNYVMPIFRYELGDLIELSSSETCNCGLGFPVVKKIIGRKNDYLLLPNGKKLRLIFDAYEGVSGIYESQIIQEDYNHIIFRIVKGNNYTQKDEQKLLKNFNSRLEGQVKIEIQYVDEISKDRNGKFKFLNNKLVDFQ